MHCLGLFTIAFSLFPFFSLPVAATFLLHRKKAPPQKKGKPRALCFHFEGEAAELSSVVKKSDRQQAKQELAQLYVHHCGR